MSPKLPIRPGATHAAGLNRYPGHRSVPSALLAQTEAFDYAAVKALTQPGTPAVPTLRIGVPDLGQYDALLAAGGA
ncbi:hypothetical protein predicted by Glimmer/Critica [Sorangium cellulosum So ce56]|uniref:Uncharacterized protein n=1 Tax=Sorangium cellulosum (strain So ce56) TaxID=448385 RepID=A9GGC2_SORC5|nr:hypothetical protein [Sorangium cellulosum]CAN96308.1 hypothetical protein predicted by Glimmer/Critica [Sorangium cellulosum So ce56]